MTGTKCEECDATVPGQGKWANIRAHNAGWYFRKDRRVFCPDHRPDYAPPAPIERDRDPRANLPGGGY